MSHNDLTSKDFIYPGRNSLNSYLKTRNHTYNSSQNSNNINRISTKPEQYIIRNCTKSKMIFRLILSTITLGIFTFFIFILSRVFSKGNSNDCFFDYNMFIWPVVMQDPEPFSENVPPPNDIVMNASIWKAASEKSSQNNFDFDGKILVTLYEAELACDALFGNNIKLNPNDETLRKKFYEFNTEKNLFYVDCVSYDQCYMPNTVNLLNLGNSIVLKVDYIVMDSPINKGFHNINSDISINKKMEYCLKKNYKNDKFYISSIREI